VQRAGIWRRERLLIIGGAALTEQILTAIEAQSGRRPAIVGVVDDLVPDVAPSAKYPLLGPVARLSEIVEETQPDRVSLDWASDAAEPRSELWWNRASLVELSSSTRLIFASG